MKPTRRTGSEGSKDIDRPVGNASSHGEHNKGNQSDAESSCENEQPEALLPLVAAALDSAADSPLTRLRQIAAHSSKRERYTPLELISDGPGGRVLRVWDEDLQREVALKEAMVNPPGGESPGLDDLKHKERLSRFIDEARITSQLDHPSIVSVHEIAADAAGRVYYTMPLVRGATLAQITRKLHAGDTTWTLPRVILIMATVCDAIAYAHARGVIHQDLKPENVMVGSFGEAIVTDWGLARVLQPDRPKVGRKVAGTPAYMAPEVAEEGGSVLGDVYGLGATLYAILTNQTPHQATVISAQGERSLKEILSKSPRSILGLAPDAPRELAAIADRAMAECPQDRYQSSGEVARDLRAWLEGRVVQAFESGPLAELRKWHRRNRGLAIALHSIAVLCLLSASVVFWLQAEKGRVVAAKEAEVNRRSYAAEIRQADLALRTGSVSEAQGSLAACETDLRGWEWDHLTLRADTSILAVHPFRDVSPSTLLRCRDGSLVLGSNSGGLLKLDGESLAPQGIQPNAHRDKIDSVCEIPSAELILSTSNSDGLRLWNALDLTPAGAIPLDDLRPVRLAALDSDRVFFLDSEGALYSLSLRTHGVQLIAEGSSRGGPLALAGTPTRLVAGTGGGTLVSASLTEVDTEPVRINLGQSVRALTPLGDDAVVVGTWDGSLFVLDPQSLQPIQPEQALQEQRILSLATSPDGETLLVGTAGGVLLLLERGANRLERRGRLLGHSNDILASLIHPDGRTISSVSSDGTLRRWDTRHLATRELKIPSTHRAFSFSETAGRIAGMTTEGLAKSVAIDADEESVLVPTQGSHPSVALVAKGKLLAVSTEGESSGESRVEFFDAASGRSEGHLEGRSATTIALDSNPDGDRLACRGNDGLLRVWDAVTRERLLELEGLGEASVLIRLGRMGESVAFQPDDSTIRVVDIASGALQAQAPIENQITALAFGDGDQVLWIGDASGRINRLDLDAGGRLELLHHEGDIVSALAATPDGTRIAIAVAPDLAIRIRDTSSGDLVLTLPGHDSPPHALAFSPDGGVLASASPDGVLHLWYAQL